MKSRLPKISFKWIWLTVALLTVGIAWGFSDQWFPIARRWAATQLAAAQKNTTTDKHDDEYEDGHEGHDEGTSLELSDQARRNIGLTDEYIREIELETFTRSMTVPAMVVERPGLTDIKVVAPMTGIVTNVYAIKGEAVLSNRLLFKIRLTHEDLVQAQTLFLKTLGELDVEKREIARLQEVTDRGIVAGKVLLEREYSKQKLEAVLSANREALLLHGFSSEQVDQIVATRHLLSELQIRTPVLHNGSGEVRLASPAINQVSASAAEDRPKNSQALDHPFVVQELNVSKGQFVQAGDTLCVLSDFRELYIEGRAFEHDADELTLVARKNWELTAVREDNGKKPEFIRGLRIVYIGNRIETDSRALHFYVALPNEILHDSKTPDGHRFLTWHYKPGQRMQLQVPVEQWENRIVLPVDAVAAEGAEYFVFVQNGDHFDRRPVHVEYRDQFSAVIANDGSLFPGDTVAFAGAHQMQVALKNKAGGGVDPHAGHNH